MCYCWIFFFYSFVVIYFTNYCTMIFYSIILYNIVSIDYYILLYIIIYYLYITSERKKKLNLSNTHFNTVVVVVLVSIYKV